MAIRECLTIGSTSPPTPPAVTPPERLPRLFLACSFLPSVLFHFIWISDLAPFAPYDFVFYVLLSLACIPFDYLLIYHLFPPNAPGKHAREAYMWYSEWCFHGGYFLVCPNFLIWRGMETTTLPLGVRIPLAIVLAFLSFMAFIFGIIGESWSLLLFPRTDLSSMSLFPQA